MPVEIDAVMTNAGRFAWSRMSVGTVGYTVPDDAPPTAGWTPYFTHFRIGEGGWEDLGAGPQPRVPSPALVYESGPDLGLTDLDAAVDAFRVGPPRYAANSRFVFEKAFVPADITFEGYTVRLRCRLELPEANNDGFGNSPEFWEIGIYSQDPTNPARRVCVAYATMPKEIKNGLKVLENIVRVRF